MIDVADRLAIHELLAQYGHIVDDEEWDRVDELFTDDCVYDMSDFEMGVAHGAEGVRALWTGPLADHPLAHHATNIVIREDADGDGTTLRVRSKGVGVGRGGRVGSVIYDDVVVSTPAGWRFAERRCTLRRPAD